MNHYLPTSNLTLEGFYFWFRSELKSINAPNSLSLFFLKKGDRAIEEFTDVMSSLKSVNLSYMKYCILIF